jgi:hypothetical protein
MSDTIAKVVLLLEQRWVRFTPAGRTLCFKTLGYTPSPAAPVLLYQVREYVMRKRWLVSHLQRVCDFLETGCTSLLLPEETVRSTLYLEYRSLRCAQHKALVAGFLDPPLDAVFLSRKQEEPDHVVALMLLGRGALCQKGEHLATFQEIVRAYK